MEYWFRKKGRELDLGEWKTADYLQMEKRGAKRWTQRDFHVQAEQ